MAKRHRIKDPFADREADRYDDPIPSREYILEFLTHYPHPMAHVQLARDLKLKGAQIEALRRRLRAMLRDGQLLDDRRGAYSLVRQNELIRGHVVGHKDGYGFVVTHDGSDDLYLNNRQMRKVFDGDEVLVQVCGIDHRGRREAHIHEVLQRNTHQVVGRYEDQADYGVVVLDSPRISHDIVIKAGGPMIVKSGQWVVVSIQEQPDTHRQASGIIVEVLGDNLAPGMEIDVAIRSHELPHIWPAEVLAQAQQLDAEPSDLDKSHRIDLRKLPLVTIDGEDARDFDDAVYCEAKRSGGWRLWVAIADVSHYVPVNSALDKEAYLRGNSVYFPDHVVPMLPEQLSNGLCSLKPQVDRLCMVCEMTISAKGRLSSYRFYEGVMHSQARLTYTKVAELLKDKYAAKKASNKAYKHVIPHLHELHSLYKILRQARLLRGAIDFDTTETRIVFGPQRKIEQIVPVQRNDAHRLIEECMLCANVATARFLQSEQLESLYRVHDGPGGEKLANLRQFLGEMGLELRGGDKPTPKDYQALIESISDRPNAHLIQTMMLRSMSQAMYQSENRGHFGLAYSAYTHFTSPIRRYPDLLVHRAIRHVIRSHQTTDRVERVRGAKRIAKKNIYPYELPDLLAAGEHCSLTERRADEATWDVIAWLKCEYLSDRVGESFNGVVTTVTAFGLFVELSDLYVEGLVHIRNLSNDYYHFDAAKQRLVGEQSRRVFQLGDAINVVVSRVNLDERKIDLKLVDMEPSLGRRKRKKRSSDRSAKRSSRKH